MHKICTRKLWITFFELWKERMFVDKLHRFLGYSFTKQAKLSTILKKWKSYPPKISYKNLTLITNVDKLSTEKRAFRGV